MEIAWRYKFFTVHELPLEALRKTREYMIRGNGEAGTILGTIKWHGQWRQFCFFPAFDTVWSADCLRDVQDAIGKIAAKRKDESCLTT